MSKLFAALLIILASYIIILSDKIIFRSVSSNIFRYNILVVKSYMPFKTIASRVFVNFRDRKFNKSNNQIFQELDNIHKEYFIYCTCKVVNPGYLVSFKF